MVSLILTASLFAGCDAGNNNNNGGHGAPGASGSASNSAPIAPAGGSASGGGSSQTAPPPASESAPSAGSPSSVSAENTGSSSSASAGNSGSSGSPGSAPARVFTASDQKNGIEIQSDYTGGKTRVFDFNEFKTDKLVYGEWSINQLIQKFGAPTKMIGSRLWVGAAQVSVEFPGFSFSMLPDLGTLSYDKNESDVNEHPLTDQDKTIQMNVIYQSVTDPAFPLSRGLEIGKSTHKDVLAAYPAGSAEDDTDSFTEYNYIWFNEYEEAQNWYPPGIRYRYDSKDILQEVGFGWLVID